MNYHFYPRNITYVCITLVALLWFGALILRAADRYVVEPGTPGGTNAGNFTDWSIAATQIQWAVDKAVDDNDTVWVSNGVYVLTNQISITNGIILRSAEGHGRDDTIINGGYVAGSATTNNRCLLISNASAFVHGFTISNGAVKIANSYEGGGGAWIYSGTLSNCTLRNNTVFALINSSAGGGGGGIFINAGTVMAARITGNIVTNIANYYGFGGGIYAKGDTSVLIYNCTIDNNNILATNAPSGAYTAYGGGIYMSGYSRVESTIISNNTTILQGFGGGVNMYGSDTVLDNCTITSNYAGYGGGIRIDGGRVTNCIISYNTHGSGRYAAGLCMASANKARPSYVDNSIIYSNIAPGYSIVYLGSSSSGSNVMRNCSIVSNKPSSATMMAVGLATTNDYLLNCDVSANDGLGIYLANGIVRNCRVTGNSNRTTGVDYHGGGMLITPGCTTALVSGCTFANNWDTNNGAGIRIEATAAGNLSVSSCIIYSNGVGGTNDVYDAASPANINALRYSCVGTNPGFTGAGIIVTNPLFKDFAGGNYRLTPSSPCVNRGSNEDWMMNAVDLDGRTRIRYGTVDMGAYERINQGAIYGFH